MRSGIGPPSDLQTLGIPVVAELEGVGMNLADHPLLGLRFGAQPPAGQPAVTPLFQVLLSLKSSPEIDEPDLLFFPTCIFPGEEDPADGIFIIFTALVRSISRGGLWLSSPRPDAAPHIDVGYFTDPADMPRILAGVQAAQRLAQLPPLASLIHKELFPGKKGRHDQAAIQQAVLEGAETFHHPVGTCKIGPASDPMAVVDPQRI